MPAIPFPVSPHNSVNKSYSGLLLNRKCYFLDLKLNHLHKEIIIIVNLITPDKLFNKINEY
jgi:hypothetical protein